jgi:hypothetical protein
VVDEPWFMARRYSVTIEPVQRTRVVAGGEARLAGPPPDGGAFLGLSPRKVRDLTE